MRYAGISDVREEPRVRPARPAGTARPAVLAAATAGAARQDVGMDVPAGIAAGTARVVAAAF